MMEIDTPPARLVIPSTPANQDFMKVLKARINEAIPVKKQRATTGTYLKALTILGWYLGSFAALFFVENTLTRLLLCLSVGLATAGIGFNIFHDSVHGSYSYTRWVNRFWAFVSCTSIGASHFIWKHKHNFLHHQYPNVQDWDDDLETRGALRLSPHQPWSIRYRFQHLYAPFIYGMTTVEWIFIRDFVRYFSGRMNEVQRLPRMSLTDHLEFWVSKLGYVALTVYLPLQYFSVTEYLIGFAVTHVACSLTLASIFQPAHVMEESLFPYANAKGGKLELPWAHLQLATTVNFAPNNGPLNWFCGGLNFQVEHHLMPGVCHAHYRKLSPIVRKTAQEFGYPYFSLSSQRAALADHYRALRSFAQRPPSAEFVVTV